MTDLDDILASVNRNYMQIEELRTTIVDLAREDTDTHKDSDNACSCPECIGARAALAAERDSQSPTPQFEVGQEVLVIDEDRKLFVQEVKRCVNHDEYRCGQADGTPWCWYKAGQLKAIPKPISEFSKGDKVVVVSTGEPLELITQELGNLTTPGRWSAWGSFEGHRTCICEEDGILSIPTKPDGTDKYTVGKWAKPDRDKHDGWLTADGAKPCWFSDFDGPAEMFMGQCLETHGYRWPISRIPKPKFEIGQTVRILDDVSKGAIFVIKEREEYEVSGWSYQGVDGRGTEYTCFECNLELADEARIPKPKFDKGQHLRTVRVAMACDGEVVQIQRHKPKNGVHEWQYRIEDVDGIVEWYCESDLELADEAPRQELPDTPPDHRGKKMRWLKLSDGAVLVRPLALGEYCYSRLNGKVMGPFRAVDDEPWPICEPVPVVQGWAKGTKWLLVTVDRQTRAVRGLNPSDLYHAPWTSGSVLFLTVAVDCFVIPDNIPIPEVPNA